MNFQIADEKSVFNIAANIGCADARRAYLEQACADRPEMRERIEVLLRMQDEEPDFLERPAETRPPSELEADEIEASANQIGPYKLLEVIGEGGMGTVYMAKQTEPVNRRVAVKLIKAGMDTKQVVARFEAERQALAVMEHPNISKVLDAGATESRPYFVMELVKGKPINEFCDEQKLDLESRLQLFQQVCHAVQHAHQKGIIHRDIKPSNVVVAMYDDQPVPKVIDFGVAKATGEQLTEKTMFTRFGQIVGTLQYMSPEQAQFNQLDIDTRTDIYSLGAVLYELLAGEPPFARDKIRNQPLDETLRMIREEEPTKPSTKLSGTAQSAQVASNRQASVEKLGRILRGDLDWIVMKALDKDRIRRYETANGLALDIGRYLNNEPVAATPPSAAYRFRKFVIRNKVGAAFAALTALFLVAGVFGLFVSNYLIKQRGNETLVALQKSDDNVELALEALDNTFLQILGGNWIDGDGFTVAVLPHQMAQTVHSSLSDSELELLETGLNFYELFASQNSESPRVAVEAARAYYRIGLLHAALGNMDQAAESHKKAIERFQILAQQEPANFEHWMALGDAQLGFFRATYSEQDKTETAAGLAAVTAYSQALEHSPGNASLYARRAIAHSWLADFGEAIADAQMAVELSPESVPYNLMMARMFQHLTSNAPFHDSKKALKYAQRALALDEQNIEAHYLIGQIYLDGIFQAKNKNERALHHATRLIELAPHQCFGYQLRAQVFQDEDRLDKALADANKAIELSPLDIWNWVARAKIFIDLGEYDLALDDLAATEELGEKHPFIFHMRCVTYLAKGDYEAALENATRALDMRSEQYIYKRRARALFHLGRYEEALADLRTAIGLGGSYAETNHALTYIGLQELANCPDDGFKNGLLQLATETMENAAVPIDTSCCLIQLSVIFGQMETLRTAVEMLSDWIEEFPKHLNASYRLALAQLKLGDIEGYRRTCAVVSKYVPELRNSVGGDQRKNIAAWTCALGPNALGDYSTILGLTQEAIDSIPDNLQYQQTHGAILFRSEQIAAAIDQLTLVSQLQKQTPNVGATYTNYFLAMAHCDAAEISLAREYLKRANDLNTMIHNSKTQIEWNQELTLELLHAEATALLDEFEERDKPEEEK